MIFGAFWKEPEASRAHRKQLVSLAEEVSSLGVCRGLDHAVDGAIACVEEPFCAMSGCAVLCDREIGSRRLPGFRLPATGFPIPDFQKLAKIDVIGLKKMTY